MNFLKNLIIYYYTLLIRSKDKKIQEDKEHTKDDTSESDLNLLGCIRFSLNKDLAINVECLMPESKDLEHLEKTAASFASFISLTVNNKMKHEILNIIKENCSNPTDTLFYENIVFNIAMLEIEKKESSSKKANEPIIKPSYVFAAGRQK